jgi:hypothetical protein
MVALAIVPCFLAAAIVGGVEVMRRGVARARPGAVFAAGLLTSLGLLGIMLAVILPDGRCDGDCGSELTAVRDTNDFAISAELAFAGLGVMALLFAVNSASHRRFRSATVSTAAALLAFALWGVLQVPALAGV